MFAGIAFSQHGPLIPDMATTAPPVPPTPPPTPTPDDDPIAFTSVVVDTLYTEVGDVIPATTMATVTCADASMTLSVAPAVPGLTWSYSAGLLKVAGTPTQQGQWRVVVTFVASDGTNHIRGATTHLVTVEDFTVAFTVGTCTNASVRIGETVDITLCSPTTAKNVDVFVSYDAGILVNSGSSAFNTPSVESGLVFSWTPGATSSGTLKLQGEIADSQPTGTITLTATYLRKGTQQTELGKSTHTIVLSPRYVAPPPPPAPTPAPPAPTPSPPPAPTPAPAPDRGPDALFSGVKALLHFDTATGLATDVKGNTFTARNVTTTDGAVAQAVNLPATGGEPTPNAYIEGNVAGVDGVDGRLTVECVVRMDAITWDALNEGGTATSESRFTPVVHASSSAGVLWALGFGSWVTAYPGGVLTRVVVPMFYSMLTSADGVHQNLCMAAMSQVLPTQPRNAFIHLAGSREPYLVDQVLQACWFDRRPGVSAEVANIAQLQSAATATVRIGGAARDEIRRAADLTTMRVIPFVGAVDEVRIGAHTRYSTATALHPNFISAALLTLPWPNN